MTKVKLPYGRKKIEMEIADSRLEGILVSKADQYKASKSEEELVREALESPIESLGLLDLDRGKEDIVIKPHKTPDSCLEM